MPLVPPDSNKVINSGLGFSLGFMGKGGFRWLREDGEVYDTRYWVCVWFRWWRLEYGYCGEVGVVEGRLEYDEG